eukprot:SAG22_NODE_2139_length_2954_cov_1.248687_1_plen_164_part_10
MATSQVYSTPSKREFSAITFEQGLEDRENCSPNMAMNLGWSQPKRFRQPGCGFASSNRAAAAPSGKSAFPAVPAAATKGFVADKVKEFVMVHHAQQKRLKTAGRFPGAGAAQSLPGQLLPPQQQLQQQQQFGQKSAQQHGQRQQQQFGSQTRRQEQQQEQQQEQ